MSSALAPRSAHVLAAERASLKRPRGAVAAAPVACGKMKFAHRVVAAKPSAPIVAAPQPPPRRILVAKWLPAGAPSAEEAVKRRKTSSSPSKPAATQAAQQQVATPATAQRPMASLVDKAMEVMRRRPRDEIAIAREKFRRELIEVEKAAMPDETISPEDLAELGLTELQYAVTPTRKQALRAAR